MGGHRSPRPSGQTPCHAPVPLRHPVPGPRRSGRLAAPGPHRSRTSAGPPSPWRTTSTTRWRPIPALMAAADATTTLRVGTMVLANDYRHPVVLAKEAATLDVLTGGRFELGIGAGLDDLGLRGRRHPARPPGRAHRPAGEAVAVLQGLLVGRAVHLRRRALPDRRPRRPAPPGHAGRPAAS